MDENGYITVQSVGWGQDGDWGRQDAVCATVCRFGLGLAVTPWEHIGATRSCVERDGGSSLCV